MRRKLELEGGSRPPAPPTLQHGEDSSHYGTSDEEEDLRQCTLAELVELLQEHAMKPVGSGDGIVAALPRPPYPVSLVQQLQCPQSRVLLRPIRSASLGSRSSTQKPPGLVTAAQPA